jgi:hypothetical protein
MDSQHFYSMEFLFSLVKTPILKDSGRFINNYLTDHMSPSVSAKEVMNSRNLYPKIKDPELMFLDNNHLDDKDGNIDNNHEPIFLLWQDGGYIFDPNSIHKACTLQKGSRIVFGKLMFFGFPKHSEKYCRVDPVILNDLLSNDLLNTNIHQSTIRKTINNNYTEVYLYWQLNDYYYQPMLSLGPIWQHTSIHVPIEEQQINYLKQKVLNPYVHYFSYINPFKMDNKVITILEEFLISKLYTNLDKERDVKKYYRENNKNIMDFSKVCIKYKPDKKYHLLKYTNNKTVLFIVDNRDNIFDYNKIFFGKPVTNSEFTIKCLKFQKSNGTFNFINYHKFTDYKKHLDEAKIDKIIQQEMICCNSDGHTFKWELKNNIYSPSLTLAGNSSYVSNFTHYKEDLRLEATMEQGLAVLNSQRSKIFNPYEQHIPYCSSQNLTEEEKPILENFLLQQRSQVLEGEEITKDSEPLMFDYKVAKINKGVFTFSHNYNLFFLAQGEKSLVQEAKFILDTLPMWAIFDKKQQYQLEDFQPQTMIDNKEYEFLFTSRLLFTNDAYLYSVEPQEMDNYLQLNKEKKITLSCLHTEGRGLYFSVGFRPYNVNSYLTNDLLFTKVNNNKIIKDYGRLNEIYLEWILEKNEENKALYYQPFLFIKFKKSYAQQFSFYQKFDNENKEQYIRIQKQQAYDLIQKLLVKSDNHKLY